MRIIVISIFCFLLSLPPGMAMEQKWVDDLNMRFPNIGTEFQEAVQQKLGQNEGDLTIEELIDKLVSTPGYSGDEIVDPQTFGIHSELMLLYPAIGKYKEGLNASKLLRDFVLEFPPDDPKVLLTFRGVYTELLIINEHYEEALRECEATLAFAPDEEGIYLSRGVAYVNLRQLDKAFEDLKILTQKPDPKNYARQLFDFIMDHRQLFQEPRIQKNTLIDVMLKDFEPPRSSKIRVPANLKTKVKSVESHVQPQATSSVENDSITQSTGDSPDPIAELIALDHEKIAQMLGPPISENDEETSIERDYNYNENTLTIGFDKVSHKVISLQMFFLPPVDEVDAFARIGLIRRDIPPTIVNNVLKVWNPYNGLSKVRLSMDEDKVLAIIVEP